MQGPSAALATCDLSRSGRWRCCDHARGFNAHRGRGAAITTRASVAATASYADAGWTLIVNSRSFTTSSKPSRIKSSFSGGG